MEQIIEEVVQSYKNMSLLELLREENAITSILYANGRDPVRTRIEILLRWEIKKRLR